MYTDSDYPDNTHIEDILGGERLSYTHDAFGRRFKVVVIVEEIPCYVDN